jgi:hypothetical protein
VFVIIGVPFEVVVTRTARVRLLVPATVAGFEAVALLRTARLRDAAVVVVAGVTVAGNETVVGLLTLLLLIIVGSGAAPRMVMFPIARDCTVDCVAGGAVTAAVVAVEPIVVPLERTAVAGFAAKVGDGTPRDDCVGVGVPITTCDGEADAVVTGAVAIAPVTMLPLVAIVPATVAAETIPPVPTAPTVAGAAVPLPLTMVMPAPLSSMMAGVASELMERLTVASGFAMSAGFWN